jgi:hypothetical protein
MPSFTEYHPAPQAEYTGLTIQGLSISPGTISPGTILIYFAGGSPTPPVGRPGHLNGGQGPQTPASHAGEGYQSSTGRILQRERRCFSGMKKVREVQMQKARQGALLKGSPRDDGVGQVPRGCGGHEPGSVCSLMQSAHTLHRGSSGPWLAGH